MSETTHDLLIIGGGPAGLSATIYATRAGLDSLTIEQGAFGGQITTTDEVDNYPGIEGVNGGELGTRLQEHAEHLGAAFAYDTIEDVTRNEDGTFTASGYDGTYTAKTLIYAAGATPRKAGFAGEDEFRGRGVSYCATCDGMFYTGKRIFVIGGGSSACEEAVFLSRFASEVTLIVRKDHLRAVNSVVKQVETNEKIEVRYLTTLTGVSGETLPTTLTFRDNGTGDTHEETYEPGSFGIFVSVGHEPLTKLVEGLVDLANDRSIVTKDDMSTKTPGLFVAGDVRKKPLRQVITAAADGAVAATSAALYLGELVI